MRDCRSGHRRSGAASGPARKCRRCSPWMLPTVPRPASCSGRRSRGRTELAIEAVDGSASGIDHHGLSAGVASVPVEWSCPVPLPFCSKRRRCRKSYSTRKSVGTVNCSVPFRYCSPFSVPKSTSIADDQSPPRRYLIAVPPVPVMDPLEIDRRGAVARALRQYALTENPLWTVSRLPTSAVGLLRACRRPRSDAPTDRQPVIAPGVAVA